MSLGRRVFLYLQLMRLTKPIGIFLLLWPTLWALWIAGQGKPDWYIVALFVGGVFLMRSAGCVINDIADRHFDKHVARTAQRPLTSGAVSLKEAFFLFFLLIGAAFLLVLQLNRFTLLLSIPAVFLACLYPFTKRWFPWPQMVLGAAFAMAVPMAFSAQCHVISSQAWLIYAIAVLWPIMYDTEYAMADREEDIKMGLNSTAIFLGNRDRLGIAILQLVILSLLAYLGYDNQWHGIYFFSLCWAALLFGYQLYLIRECDPKQCFKAFLNNQWVGFVIFIGIVLSCTTIF